MDDHTIIRRIQDGNTDAFAVIVRRYHVDLLNFIFRIVKDPDLAEDIGQEVFLNVYKELPRFDSDRGTPFLAWLYIVARNQCVSELRKQKWGVAGPVEDFDSLTAHRETAEALLIDREEREALAACLSELPEPFRSSILLSLDGASLEEIANLCGVPQATVKTRLFRARERIKLLVKEYFGGDGHVRRI